MIPPYLKRSLSPDKGRAGRSAESSLSQRLGGMQTPGSGALKGAKADVTVGDFLVENKSSTNDSFSIRKEQLRKVYQEALEIGKKPALSFQFVNVEGGSSKKDRWICMREADFLEFLG